MQQPPYTYMSPLSIQRCPREPCFSGDLHCWLAFCSGGSYWFPVLSNTASEPIRRWGQGKAQCVIGHTELWFRSTGMGPEKRRNRAALCKNNYTGQVNRTCLIFKKINKSFNVECFGTKRKPTCLGLEYDTWQADELNSSDGCIVCITFCPTQYELPPSVLISCAYVVFKVSITPGKSMEMHKNILSNIMAYFSLYPFISFVRNWLLVEKCTFKWLEGFLQSAADPPTRSKIFQEGFSQGKSKDVPQNKNLVYIVCSYLSALTDTNW